MTLRSFTQAPARILPVIVLADTSGSMHGEKIAELNHALREMIANLGLVHEQRAQIYVAIVRFGGDTADVVMPLTPAAQCTPPEFAAEGRTPLGAALELVNALLVDEEQVPVSAYAPAIILVSDGLPTDTGFKEACTSTPRLNHFLSTWEPLQQLLNSPRGSKATRLAVAIGDDASLDVLKSFVNSPSIPVVKAQDAGDIQKFFAWATQSIVSRVTSRNPNDSIVAPMDDFADDELVP